MSKSESMASFDLRDEQWIRAIGIDGELLELSLREVLLRAPEVKELIGDIPQQTMPILRLIIAVIRASTREQGLGRRALFDKWLDLWEQGHFDKSEVNGYLDKFDCQFNLFGSHPFYQVPGLMYDSDKMFDPVSEMMADVPKPDKYLFSLRGKTAPNEMSFAAAARWLVFIQAYDVAGIHTPVVGNTNVKSGKVYPPKGIPSTGWLGNLGGVYLEGSNLFETIMWNLVMFDSSYEDVSLCGNPEDLASWELPVPGADGRILLSPTGPIGLETLQSRRLRLVLNEAGTSVVGIVNCYGDALHPVMASAVEKMTAWRQSKEQQKKLNMTSMPLMPLGHDGSKALWQGLPGLLQIQQDKGGETVDLRPGVIRWAEQLFDYIDELEDDNGVSFPRQFTIHAQGMEYGTQSSVFVNGFDDRMTIGSVLVRHDSRAVRAASSLANASEQAAYWVAKLAEEIEGINGDRRRDAVAKAALADAKEHAYSLIDPVYRDFLAGFTNEKDVDEYVAEWRDALRGVVLDLGFECMRRIQVPVFQSRNGDYLPRARRRFISRVFELFPREGQGEPAPSKGKVNDER